VIRGARPQDYASFATLFREPGDTTPSLEQWSSELAKTTLISERGGRIEGYVTFIALSEAGHVRNLVVAPDARRIGVGRELMYAAAEALRARGIGEWHLNVKVDNAAAIRLYEGLGMEVEHRSTVLRVPLAGITELPRDAATALSVDPAEDDDLERALGLLAGRIAMMRIKSGRVLVQLRDRTCAAVGFAAFDPSLPGAMPFRVAHSTLAGTLLAALARHTSESNIQVVIDDDARTTELLLEIGAETRLELLHYRGTLRDAPVSLGAR
jgi:ribosomal-protein-alanine N-acetyltransferase